MGVSRGTKVTKTNITNLMEDCRSLCYGAYGYDKPNITSVLTTVQNSTLAIFDGMNRIQHALQSIYNDFNNTTLYTFDGTTTTLSSPDIVSVNTLILASDYNGLESTHNTYSNICFTYTPCSCNGHICSCDGVDSSCYLRCYPETPGTCDPLDACGDFSYESYTSSQSPPYYCDIFWCSAYYWGTNGEDFVDCSTAFMINNCNPYGYYCHNGGGGCNCDGEDCSGLTAC